LAKCLRRKESSPTPRYRAVPDPALRGNEVLLASLPLSLSLPFIPSLLIDPAIKLSFSLCCSYQEPDDLKPGRQCSCIFQQTGNTALTKRCKCINRTATTGAALVLCRG